ncbi:MAG: hypothetical protein NTX58_00710, partial [Actinobacteria bacterium]|nr:hypothetical protein [Actinomycetota bacterium]
MTRTRSLVIFAVVAAMVLSFGCSGSEDEVNTAQGAGDTNADTNADTNTDTTKTTEPAKQAGPLGSGEAVTIAFAGDASFEGLSSSVVSNTTGLLSAIAPVMSAADISMVNVETAVRTGGTA